MRHVSGKRHVSGQVLFRRITERAVGTDRFANAIDSPVICRTGLGCFVAALENGITRRIERFWAVACNVASSVWLCAAAPGSPTQANVVPNDTGPHPAGHGGADVYPFATFTQNPFSKVWPGEQKADWAAAGSDVQQIACNETNNPMMKLRPAKPKTHPLRIFAPVEAPARLPTSSPFERNNKPRPQKSPKPNWRTLESSTHPIYGCFLNTT